MWIFEPDGAWTEIEQQTESDEEEFKKMGIDIALKGS
jgi:hypothetical protein